MDAADLKTVIKQFAEKDFNEVAAGGPEYPWHHATLTLWSVVPQRFTALSPQNSRTSPVPRKIRKCAMMEGPLGIRGAEAKRGGLGYHNNKQTKKTLQR